MDNLIFGIKISRGDIFIPWDMDIPLKHTEENSVDYQALQNVKNGFVEINKKVNAKKRELEIRRRLVQVERSIVSAAPLILVAPHRSYIKEGFLKFSFKNEFLSGMVYILNDCIVLTKSLTKTKDKGVVNMLINMKASTNPNVQNTLTENHYLETIPLKELELIEINSVQFSLQQHKEKWDFCFDSEDTKRDWFTAFKEVIDAYELHVLFEEGIYKPDKPIQILHATYGKLKHEKTEKNSDPEQVEVTHKLQKIMEQQGGNQLILNSGSKKKIFNFPTKKVKDKKLRIVCSIKGSIKVLIYPDQDAVLLTPDTV